jgi:hypothetical protein
LAAVLLLLTLVTLMGCHYPAVGRGFSAHEILAANELRIHADFELPADHPLIAELSQQKRRLADVTGLTFSAAKLPIDVYLFRDRGSFDDFTSKSNVAFASGRAFFLKSDSMLNVYAVWGNRAAEDLRHEVTHGYLHSVAPSLPLWIDEGLAEYFEVGPGTGGLNWAHVQHLADAFQQQTWTPSLGRMETLHDPTKLTQTDYAEAWLWTHFLLSEDSTAALVRSQMQRYQNKTGVAWTAKVHHLVHDPNQRLLEHLQALKQ